MTKLTRSWTVFVVPHTHTDIGYTDDQEVVFGQHLEFLDQVVDFCKRTGDEDDASQFCWTCEVAWQIDHYRRHRTRRQYQALMALVGEGRVDAGALYVNPTDLLDIELLARTLEPLARIRKDSGAALPSALASDINGLNWGVAKVLASAGVKYVDVASNATRALNRVPPHQFQWESPDGARLLVWDGEIYVLGNLLGLDEGPDAIEQRLLPYLAHLERAGYPDNHVALRVQSKAGDNQPPSLDICRHVKSWNKRHAMPRLRMATVTQWMQYAQKHSKRRELPVVRGAWPDWWSDGLGSTPHETAAVRESQRNLARIDAALAVTPSAKKNLLAQTAEVQNNIWFYAEHTFGASNSVNKPNDPTVRRQWNFKKRYADNALRQSEALVSQLKLPAVGLGIPSCKKLGLAVPKDLLIDSPHYAVQLCRTTGGIASLIDKDTGRQWVRQGSEYCLGSWLLETIISPGGRNDLWDDDHHSPESREEYWVINRTKSRVRRRAKFAHVVSKLEAASITRRGSTIDINIELKLPTCNGIRGKIAIGLEQKRIDLTYVVDRQAVLEPNGLFLAFPFAVSKPEMRLENAGGWFRPGAEQVPLSATDWYCINRWAAISNQQAAVYWASLDAPLVQLHRMRSGNWSPALGKSNGTLFSWVNNNYWYTNFKATQGGKGVYRYSLTTDDAPFDPAKAESFTRSVTGEDYIDTLCPMRWANANITLRSMRRLPDAKGIILRLEEVSGIGTQVALESRCAEPVLVKEVDLIDPEAVRKSHKPSKSVRLRFRPHELKTIAITQDAGR